MKFISINAYGGKLTDAFVKFLKKNEDVDVFCLQEVYHDAQNKDMVWGVLGSNLNFLEDITKNCPGYDSYYRPHLEDWWGLAMLVKKDFPVLEEGETFVHKFKGHDPKKEPLGYTAKNIQFVKTENNDKPITILNFHGLWNGNGKGDTEDRLEQSRNIIKFVKTIKGDFILWGDFNLSPDTESLQMISRGLGCKELIKEYGITSTRTSLYEKPNKFADYLFVSNGLEIKNFEALPDVVSDHVPLLLEI
jgi:endonuclease/exonuclease/phosphatase family metal-dependent hydrolase